MPSIAKQKNKTAKPTKAKVKTPPRERKAVKKKVTGKGTKERAAKQNKFLEALKESFGIISTAAAKIGVTQQAVWYWRIEDPAFNDEVEKVKDMFVDVAEDILFEKIQQKETRALTFYLAARSRKYQRNFKFNGEGGNGDGRDFSFSFELTTVPDPEDGFFDQ